MNTSINIFPAAQVALKPEAPRAESVPCASCHLKKACMPGTLNARETQQFEGVVVGRRRIARHASLFRQQDRLGILYAIRYGQFKAIGGGLPGEQRAAGFHMAGELVGLDAIATGQHQFRTMALENSEVCEIDFAALTRLMSVEPAIQRQFLQAMSEALVREFVRSASLATMSLDQRFARFLVNLGERYARLGYSDNAFRLSMSRGDIGSYLGSTNESVSRLIARFNANGSILISGREVGLLDRPYLRALADGHGDAFRFGDAAALPPARRRRPTSPA
jgi:CRP/FNR family transcriptional regulator